MQAQMRRWGAGNHMHARVSIPISLCLLSVVWSPGQEAEQKVENGGLSSHLDILFLFSFFSPLCVVLLHRSCTINGAAWVHQRRSPHLQPIRTSTPAWPRRSLPTACDDNRTIIKPRLGSFFLVQSSFFCSATLYFATLKVFKRSRKNPVHIPVQHQ